jgi:hypothetical protein
MYFSHAFRKTLLAVETSAGNGTLDTTVSAATSALTAGELGLYNQSFGVIDFTGGSIGTAYTKPFYIVQGSYYKTAGYSDIIGTHGGYQESVKSKMINPKYITRLFWVAAKAPRQQVVQIPVTCGLTCDTTYRLRVDVKGSPALRFLSHNLYRVLDSYTGCCSTTNPGFVKDPVATIVNWKEQLNASPYFNNMVQARAFALKTTNTTTSANATSVSTTAATFVPGSFTGIYVGQRVIGVDVPANAYVTTVNGTTDITISYPTQATAPAASVFNAKSLKYYNDLYSSQSMGAQQINYQGMPTYIAGTTTATNATIAAASTVASATSGAHIFIAAADAASFTSDCFLELTAAYVETKFGNATFTVTDNYDVEPLKIIASVMDDSGNPCLTTCIGSSPNIGIAGIATEVQSAVQVQGIGETVLRDLILTGKYRQEAFGDGVNIDTFRMREIEANPGVLSMMSLANRNALYNKFCILHSVPRFNNPSGVFDNDQYLIEIAVPSTVGLGQFFNATTVTNGVVATITTSSSAKYGDYIAAAANYAASGSATSNTIPVEVI